MIDLYQKLGLEPGASEAEIAGALNDHPEAKAYASVLLDSKKRPLYDRTYKTLKSIGLLRHRLKLESGDSWFQQNYPEFSGRATVSSASGKSSDAVSDSGSVAEPQVDPISVAAPSKISNRPGWVIPVVLGVVGVLLLVLALRFI